MKEVVIEKTSSGQEEGYTELMALLHKLGNDVMAREIAQEALAAYTERFMTVISEMPPSDVPIMMVAMRTTLQAFELDPNYKALADRFCPSFGITTASIIMKKENK